MTEEREDALVHQHPIPSTPPTSPLRGASSATRDELAELILRYRDERYRVEGQRPTDFTGAPDPQC
jgi:hypothetical protein